VRGLMPNSTGMTQGTVWLIRWCWTQLDDNPVRATTEPHGSVVAFHMPPASMAREPPLPNCGLDHIAKRPVRG
jgi:hypothetical protein